MTTTIQGSDQVLDSDGAILKTDEKGRVRTPAARRESLLDEFERSGLSGAKFAALAGIKYPTFAVWAQQRRRQRGGRTTVRARPNDPVRWLEAVVEAAARRVSWHPAWACSCPGASGWNSTTRNKCPWWPRCCAPWKSHAEFFGELEGVRGGGGLRHAQRF